jgi:heme/copper-type cytochrome/quinol oxidase subunit 2
MKEATIQLPRQLSTLAPGIDDMYYFIFWVSVAFFVAIIGVAIWCLIAFRADTRWPRPLGIMTCSSCSGRSRRSCS